MKFFVEIRRFLLRSRFRIIIVHQPLCTSVRSFVRLPENVPAPISLISSRPECTIQVLPHNLIHHTTHRNSMLTALDLSSTIHPVDNNLVVHQNLQTTMFIRGPCRIPGIAVITWSLCTFHRGIAHARRLRRFQVQHNMPRVLQLFRQGEPLSPRVACLEFRNPGVTQETRERTFPVVRSTRKRAFPLRAVPIILLGQFDVVVPPHFIAAPCHRLFPISASLRITWTTHHLPCCNTHI